MKIKFSYLMAAVLLLIKLPSPALFAQQFVMEWSIDGRPAAGFTVDSRPEISTLLDFNRDGIPDKPLMEEEGILYIIDGANPSTKWTIPLPPQFTLSELLWLTGFYEMDGNSDTREIVFADKQGGRYTGPVVLSMLIGLLLPSITHTYDSDVYLLGLIDIDKDGKVEIIVGAGVGAGPHVQVWGFQ